MREIHWNTPTASADLSTAGGMKNALSYGLSSKYLPLHLEGAKTCKFTQFEYSYQTGFHTAPSPFTAI